MARVVDTIVRLHNENERLRQQRIADAEEYVEILVALVQDVFVDE